MAKKRLSSETLCQISTPHYHINNPLRCILFTKYVAQVKHKVHAVQWKHSNTTEKKKQKWPQSKIIFWGSSDGCNSPYPISILQVSSDWIMSFSPSNLYETLPITLSTMNTEKRLLSESKAKIMFAYYVDSNR